MEDWCSSANAHHNAAMEFYTDGSLLVANGDSGQASFDRGDCTWLTLLAPAVSFASLFWCSSMCCRLLGRYQPRSGAIQTDEGNASLM